MTQIIPIILSGGQGTRLWPLSRGDMPKQFIPFLFGESLFAQTVKRVSDPSVFSAPIIICAHNHRFLVRDIMRNCNIIPNQIITEQVGRNTAPALCVAAMQENLPKDALLLILPSDHYIPDTDAFVKTVKDGISLAQNGKIVTFGIKPYKPHTGFGYIEQGDIIGTGFTVKKFHEKPNEIAAKAYIESGKFLWNAGIFLTRADIYISELNKFAPDVVENIKATIAASTLDLGDLVLNAQCFAQTTDISIDVAVMEKTDAAAVIPASFKWDDLGSWGALWDIADKDENKNVINGDVIAANVSGSYLRTDGALLCAVGVDNIIAVVEGDAVFIGNRENSEQIKTLITRLKTEKRDELNNGLRTYRPWGYYQVISDDKNYKVKRICVNNGCRLSLQKHAHRSEHWVVVRGTADVINGNETFKLQVNQSTYIPSGEIHRLGNSSGEELEIIEVQVGNYLGEDDIIRLDDDYMR